MDHAGELHSVSRRSADLDHRGLPQVGLEDRKGPFQGIGVHGLQRFVDDHPTGFLHEEPGKGQEALLVVTEFAFPTGLAIERRREMVEPDLRKRSHEHLVGETCRRADRQGRRAGGRGGNKAREE